MTLMNTLQRGAISAWMITSIFLIAAVVATGSATVWAYVHYFNEKNTVDTQVDTAVAIATKKQADADALQKQKEDKLPNRTFVGPDDYGSLSFDYPKTWSVYVDKDGSAAGTAYTAYLNPISVPPVSLTTQQFALRVIIEQKDYNTVIASYASLVKSGQLTSSPVKVGGQDGTRLDGNFTKDIRGSAVIFKIRDRTVTIRTDADTFDTDYNALITTIKFNS
jgi:hypothetical protein